MSARPLILGTAGHIDHGKTALVRALTGVDTDRLTEEKQRGISIELGFAHLDLGDHRLGIVDVPGHERFIRNMLAGASGVDLAMLVIAADDSVMPQTREHLAILQLLRIPVGLIALTKIDLAEPSWLDLVEEEIRELTAGTFLEGAPIVRTSATTGAGIDELKNALAALAEKSELQDARSGGFFRMPIDRAFVLQGLGTVVTGTVASGSTSVNDELELLPEGKAVRVRSLQSHGSDAETVARGQRAAINLQGAHHTEIERGCELAAPGSLKPSRRLTVHLKALPDAPWPIRHRTRVRLHVGTQEIMAEVRLLEGNALEPGRDGFAQLIADEPVVATGRQPFVVRSESPLVTIGGGEVLQPVAPRIRRKDDAARARLDELMSKEDETRAAATIWFQGHEPWTVTDLGRDAGLSRTRADELIASFEREGLIETITLPTRAERRLHRDVLAGLGDRLLATVRLMHEESPLEKAIPGKRLAARLAYLPEEVIAGILDHLIATGRLVGDEQTVASPDFQPQLSETQLGLRDAVVEAYRTAGFSPPDPAELAQDQGVTDRQLRPILDLCVSEGALVHIEGSMFMHAEAHADLKQRITDALGAGEGLTMSEIRQLLDTSRKYAVPICEHLDRIGLTVRKGDVRILKRPVAAGTESGS